MSAKPRFATVWLGGCSGCHMSFLDLDEWLFELAGLVDVVFTPIADVKEFPENVDVALVEGAVANEENEEMLLRVRQNSRILVALGDCAATGNVTALRNPLGLALEVLKPVYIDRGDLNPRIPDEHKIVPVLLDRVVPIHQVVPVDYFLPGCPPSATAIREALQAVLAGKSLDGMTRRFG
jgi:NAD-reducing hydrogenase small subunit